MSKFEHVQFTDSENGTVLMVDPYLTPKVAGSCITVGIDGICDADNHVYLPLDDTYALRDALVKLCEELELHVIENMGDHMGTKALDELISKRSKGGDT